MSILKKINEAVTEEGRERLKKSFQANIRATYKIDADDAAIDAFIDGGDAPGLSKLVDDLDKAGFDTAGGWTENKEFLEKMGFTKGGWMNMMAESFRIADNIIIEKEGYKEVSFGDVKRGYKFFKKNNPELELIKTAKNKFKKKLRTVKGGAINFKLDPSEKVLVKETCGASHEDEELSTNLTNKQKAELVQHVYDVLLDDGESKDLDAAAEMFGMELEDIAGLEFDDQEKLIDELMNMYRRKLK